MCCGVAPNEVCCLRFQCANQGTANEFCSDCTGGLRQCVPGGECCDIFDEQHECCGTPGNEVCCLRSQCRNPGTADEFCSPCPIDQRQCGPGQECCDIFDEQHTCCGTPGNQVCCLRFECLNQGTANEVCSPPTTAPPTTAPPTTAPPTTAPPTTAPPTTAPPCTDPGVACVDDNQCCEGRDCTEFGFCVCSPTNGGCDALDDCCFNSCDTTDHLCVNCISPNHTGCTADNQCCTGTCEGGTCVGCQDPQFECNENSDCCNQDCVLVPGSSAGFCDCIPFGWQCDAGAQCCSGLICDNGLCRTAP